MQHIEIEIEENKARRAEAAMDSHRQRTGVVDDGAMEQGWNEIFLEAIAESERLFCHSTGAEDYLDEASEQMRDRAQSRDQDDGERSMARAVAAFNTLYGHELSETEGWQFMSLLKKSRGAGGAYREDDYVDDIAYCALAAESAQQELA